MIVSALLMIVGGGLLTTFITGQTSYLSADAHIQVQQEARRAFDNVVRELREAGAQAGQNITTTAGLAANSQLNFQIARGYNSEPSCQVPTPTICWGSENATGQWVHYALVSSDGNLNTTNDNQLIRCVDTSQNPGIIATTSCSGGRRVLANHVRSASFAYVGGTTQTITVTVQIQYTSPLLPSGSQATPTLTSQVRLRNP
jgi:Tfp pilus assembly protein PilW